MCNSRQDPATGEEECSTETAGGGNTHHHLPSLPAEEVRHTLILQAVSGSSLHLYSYMSVSSL